MSRSSLLVTFLFLPPLAFQLLLSGCAARGNTHGLREGRASAESAIFEDITARGGLRYRWSIPGKRPLSILQTIGNGCAFLDYDNDGNLDILLVGPRLALYRGKGGGAFEDVTSRTAVAKLNGRFLGCAAGDYDNDGYTDLYIAAYRGGALLHNERANQPAPASSSHGGDRIFHEVGKESGIHPQPWATSAAFVDIDSDGLLDLYVGNYVKFGPTDPQLCDSNGHMTSCGPRFYAAEPPALYRNLGGGRFQEVSREWNAIAATGKALGIACADYDGSGRQSISIANDEVAGDLLRNTGGKFKNDAAIAGTAYDTNGNVHGGMGTDWGDYDGDGLLDLFVATFQNEAKCLYHNDGKGQFTEKSGALGLADPTSPNVTFGARFLDYDNDGWLDLMITNGHVQDNIADIDRTTTYRQRPQLFHNLSGQAFEDVSAAAGTAFGKSIVGRGLATGDFDNDGRIDALIVDSEGSPILLRNVTAPNSRWVSIVLEGAASNRDGIGALVIVESGGRKILRRCATDGSFMSASDRRIHVGLGSSRAASVTVIWPGGHTDKYLNVPVNRVIRLREGTPSPVESKPSHSSS